MPLPPPVTMARRPSSRLISSLVLFGGDRPSAVGGDYGALHVAAVIARQESCDASYFLGFAETPERHLGPTLDDCRFVELSDRGRGPDHARRNRVDPDSLRAQFHRRRASKPDDPRLQRGIGDRILGWMEGGDRRQVDDRTAAAPLHLRGHRLGGPDQAFDAAGEHAIDSLAVDLAQRLEPGPNRVVDEYGDRSAELAFDVSKHRVNVVAPADVDGEGARVEAFAHEFRDRGFEPPRADVDAGEAGAFAAESLCDRQADASGSAGDDADPIL